MQRQSPEDINFTCIQSRQHPASKTHHCLPHHRVHIHPNKAACSPTASPAFPLQKHPSLPLCSRYTTLAWDGMRKHRPKIPLDPETSSCSWIYHTNKERRGKKMPVTPQQKIPSKNMLSCFKMHTHIQTGPFSPSIFFFCYSTLIAQTAQTHKHIKSFCYQIREQNHLLVRGTEFSEQWWLTILWWSVSFN